MKAAGATGSTTRLGDFVKIRTGKLDANASSPDGEYPFFTCSEEPLRIASFTYDCECVLVAGNGDLNVKYYDGKFDAYQRTYIIESADKQALDVRYLFHYMSLYVEQLRAMSVGGVIKYIKLGYLTDARIPLPPLEEQRRIAQVLDRAEALRAKRRAALAQLDSLTQSLFLDLFGDPATNPKGFPVLQFADTCDRIFKGAFDLKASSYREHGIPFIRIADIQGNTIDLAHSVYVDERTYSQYRGSELEPGDVVFSKVGTIDRIAVIPESIPRCLISQNNVGAKLRHSVANSTYSHAFLTTPYALGKIRAGSKKAVQDKLVLEELRKLPFMLPPITLQREFARRVTAVEALKTAQRASLAELDKLFACLQHRAFKGELFDERDRGSQVA